MRISSVILLYLLPFVSSFSWSEEDNVWYCVEEQRANIVQDEKTGAYGVRNYVPEKFTLKYEADSNRLAIKGRLYGGSDLQYSDCHYCNPEIPLFNAGAPFRVFTMEGDRFFIGGAWFNTAQMISGTCTKF